MPSATSEDRLAPRAGRVRTFRPGRASGPLLGGNLTVLTALVGTPFLPSFEGAILFIEDVDEAQYRIDRMLTQLALAGILGRVAGVVFGQCTDCVNRGSNLGGFTLSEVLAQHLTPLGVPAFQGALVRPCHRSVQHARRHPRRDRRDGGNDPDAGAGGGLTAALQFLVAC